MPVVLVVGKLPGASVVPTNIVRLVDECMWVLDDTVENFAGRIVARARKVTPSFYHLNPHYLLSSSFMLLMYEFYQTVYLSIFIYWGILLVCFVLQYMRMLIPPFAAALYKYSRLHEYSFAAPGHQAPTSSLWLWMIYV